MHDDAPTEAGPVLGSFRLRRPLGSGAFATAFLASQEGTDRLAVVKIARRDRMNGPAAAHVREVFANEARCASQVSHPNLVTIYAAGELADSRPAIAMEYFPADTLRAFLVDRAPLEPSEILGIFVPLASALEALHSVGIEHRDVSADNILARTDPPPTVKLLDFGVAKLPQLSAKDFSLLGTWRYMAPEHLRGQPSVKSDMFGVGMLLWWALLGREYRAEEREMVPFVRHILALEKAPDPREVAPDLSRRMATIVMALLSPREDERPSATTLRTMLRAALSDWNDETHPGDQAPPLVRGLTSDISPGPASNGAKADRMNADTRPPTGRGRRIVTTRPLGASSEAEAAATADQLKVLLIDSDRLAASSLIGKLVSFDLDVAASIDRAMTMLRAERFHIVLIAELVEGTSGYDLVDLVRSLASRPGQRVFIHGKGLDRGRWSASGADGYVSLAWTADAIIQRLTPAVSTPPPAPLPLGPAPFAASSGLTEMPLWLGELEDAIVHEDATLAEQMCDLIAREAQRVDATRLATRVEMVRHAARARRPSQVRLLELLMEEYESFSRALRLKS
ncbi:MAG: serine/threonine-protein kinase [Myxococcota bacterium]